MNSIVNLSQDKQKDLFNSIDMIIADCDGVIFLKNNIIPGCGDVINKFRQLGKKVLLVSNNSIDHVELFRKTIKDAKIYDFPDDDIVVPSTTIIKYLNSINFNKRLYTLCSDSMIEELQQAGYHCDNGRNLNADAIHGQLDLDPEVGAVIVDSDKNVNYMKVAKAVHYLKRPDTLFITGATDEWHPLKKNIIILGPGHFQRLIASASGCRPIILGKPGKELGDFLIQNYEIENPQKVLFIGDSLGTDISFAYKQGFRSLLVLTGLTEMESAMEGIKVAVTSKQGYERTEIVRPEFYIDTMANLMPILKELDASKI